MKAQSIARVKPCIRPARGGGRRSATIVGGRLQGAAAVGDSPRHAATGASASVQAQERGKRCYKL